jgi:hypothetical protein
MAAAVLQELNFLSGVDPKSIRIDLPEYMGKPVFDANGEIIRYEGGKKRRNKMSKKNKKKKSKKNKKKKKSIKRKK